MHLKQWTSLLLIFYVSALAEAAFSLSVGPEVFRFIRQREGGTHQEGTLTGVRINFDRIKRYRVYLGADYIYSNGTLKGKAASGSVLISDLTDHIFEGRLGFTFQQNTERAPFFAPFAGWGYFHETNAFVPPSPLPYTFTDTFHYFAAGFLSGIKINPGLSVGVNFKLKFMQNATSFVSDDPVYDEVTLTIKDELLARLDLPIYYHPPKLLFKTGMELTPFFEYRHFGGREGFPFNFRDTKFYLYGARFALTFPF